MQNDLTKSNSGYELKNEHLEKFNNDTKLYNTVPTKLEANKSRDELDELLQVEREWNDHEKPFKTLPNGISSSNEVIHLVHLIS